jgi:hypothetical protein
LEKQNEASKSIHKFDFFSYFEKAKSIILKQTLSTRYASGRLNVHRYIICDKHTRPNYTPKHKPSTSLIAHQYMQNEIDSPKQQSNKPIQD